MKGNACQTIGRNVKLVLFNITVFMINPGFCNMQSLNKLFDPNNPQIQYLDTYHVLGPGTNRSQSINTTCDMYSCQRRAQYVFTYLVSSLSYTVKFSTRE